LYPKAHITGDQWAVGWPSWILLEPSVFDEVLALKPLLPTIGNAA
jgi:hypothetical protein